MFEYPFQVGTQHGTFCTVTVGMWRRPSPGMCVQRLHVAGSTCMLTDAPQVRGYWIISVLYLFERAHNVRLKIVVTLALLLNAPIQIS